MQKNVRNQFLQSTGIFAIIGMEKQVWGDYVFTELIQIEKLKEIDRKLTVCTKNGEYSKDNANRSCLTAYWEAEGERSAIAIGINPSKANDRRSDKTITTLSRFLDTYGYSEIYMLNIFESYSTQQSGIDKATKTDFKKYASLFEKVDAVFIVWGLDDDYKDEKKEILSFLKQYEDKLFCLKNQNNRYPIHPSRMKYNDSLVQCKIS